MFLKSFCIKATEIVLQTVGPGGEGANLGGCWQGGKDTGFITDLMSSPRITSLRKQHQHSRASSFFVEAAQTLITLAEASMICKELEATGALRAAIAPPCPTEPSSTSEAPAKPAGPQGCQDSPPMPDIASQSLSRAPCPDYTAGIQSWIPTQTSGKYDALVKKHAEGRWGQAVLAPSLASEAETQACPWDHAYLSTQLIYKYIPRSRFRLNQVRNWITYKQDPCP